MTDTDGDNRSDYNKAVHAVLTKSLANTKYRTYKVAVGGTQPVVT